MRRLAIRTIVALGVLSSGCRSCDAAKVAKVADATVEASVAPVFAPMEAGSATGSVTLNGTTASLKFASIVNDKEGWPRLALFADYRSCEATWGTTNDAIITFSLARDGHGVYFGSEYPAGATARFYLRDRSVESADPSGALVSFAAPMKVAAGQRVRGRFRLDAKRAAQGKYGEPFEARGEGEFDAITCDDAPEAPEPTYPSSIATDGIRGTFDGAPFATKTVILVRTRDGTAIDRVSVLPDGTTCETWISARSPSITFLYVGGGGLLPALGRPQPARFAVVDARKDNHIYAPSSPGSGAWIELESGALTVKEPRGRLAAAAVPDDLPFSISGSFRATVCPAGDW